MTKRSEEPQTLPEFLKRYFWEVEFENVRLPEREFYVIERVIEYGNDEAIHWLKQRFTPDDIGRVVRPSRALSRRTANLWGKFLHIPRDEMRCYSTPSILQHGSFSNS